MPRFVRTLLHRRDRPRGMISFPAHLTRRPRLLPALGSSCAAVAPERNSAAPSRLRHLAVFLVLAFIATGVFAAAPSVEEQVRAADAARVHATIAADADQLAPLLSASLIYGHADGRVQDKQDYLQAVAAKRLRYDRYDYEELRVIPIAPDAAVMTGRARLQASFDGHSVPMRLRFLAVWRREQDTWRLFAYQSSLADTAAVPVAPPRE